MIPLHRDAGGTPNASQATLNAIAGAQHRAGDHLAVESLFAYCYAVLAGADYTERFAEELETPGPRIPITADVALFDQVVQHGETLLWLHTFGERFNSPDRPRTIPPYGGVAWPEPVTRLAQDSKDMSFDPVRCELRVADGLLTGVTPEVWAFEVSGMAVVKKWLGYRTRKGAGKATSSSSPLDKIRPEEWPTEWSDELAELVTVLQRTIDLLRLGVELLDRVCSGPLIAADDLPPVPPELREPPPASWGEGGITLDGV